MSIRLLILGLAALLSVTLAFSDIPLPSLNDMALVLVLHDLESNSYLHSNMRDQSFFIYIDGKDLPTEYLQRISAKGIKCFPGSKWVPGKGMKLAISKPIQRKDGDYDVSYTFYLDSLGGSGNSAVMRLGSSGWLVVSSGMRWIS
jgi:hypothetical protein